MTEKMKATKQDIFTRLSEVKECESEVKGCACHCIVQGTPAQGPDAVHNEPQCSLQQDP